GLPVHGQQPDQLLAQRVLVGHTCEGALACEVGLLLGDRPPQAQVLWRDGAVGVLPDDRIALLRAQDVHGLGAVRRDAVRVAGLEQALQDRDRVPGADVDLEGELAGEADPGQADWYSAEGSVTPGHETERLVRDIYPAEDRADDVAGAGTDDGDG